jgi:hypothetical protein
MVYRKGELNSKAIDRGWPYQVALASARTYGADYVSARLFCERLSLCPRGHSFRKDGADFNAWCFAKLDDAQVFATKFGGELLPVEDRPRWGKNSP